MFALEKQVQQPGARQTLVTLVEYVAGTQDENGELSSTSTDIKQIWCSLNPVRGTRVIQLSKEGINQPVIMRCDYNLQLVEAGAQKELNQRYLIRDSDGILYTINSITNIGHAMTSFEVLLSVRSKDVR